MIEGYSKANGYESRTEYLCIRFNHVERRFQLERQNNVVVIKFLDDLFGLKKCLSLYQKMVTQNNNLKIEDFLTNKAEGLEKYYQIFDVNDVIDEYLLYKLDNKFYLSYQKYHQEINECLELFFEFNTKLPVYKYEKLKLELFVKYDSSQNQKEMSNCDKGQSTSSKDSPISPPRADLLYESNLLNNDEYYTPIQDQIFNSRDYYKPMEISLKECFNPNDDSRSISIRSESDNFQKIENGESTNLDESQYYIYTGGSNGPMKQFSNLSAQKIQTYEKIHQGTIHTIVKTPNNDRQFTGGADGCVIEWDTRNKQKIKNYGKVHDIVLAMVITQNGDTLITGGGDGHLKVWDVKNQVLYKDYGKAHENQIWSLAVSLDKTKLFSGDNGGVMKQWDFLSHELLKNYGKVHIGYIYGMCITPDGKSQFTIGRNDKKLIEWDIVSESIKRDFGKICHYRLTSMTISPNGDSVFTGDGGGYLKEWDTNSGVMTKNYGKVHENGITCMEVTQNGKMLFTGSYDQHLKEWDLTTKKIIKDYGTGHNDSIISIAIVQC